MTEQEFLTSDYKLVAQIEEQIVFSSHEDGISPALQILQLAQADKVVVFDKFVGKAAATIFVISKVKKVFAKTMSISAKDFLTANKIAFEYDSLVEKILNRAKTDYCPMEKTVLNETDPKIALSLLLDFVENKKNKK